MVRTIIFDLGGVILPIYPDNTVREFEKLGLKGFDKIYTLKKQEHFFDEFEKGRINATSFRNEIKSHYEKKVSDEQIDFAWNALIGELTPERFSFLSDLKTKYNLFLLSNTNIIHHTCFTKMFNTVFGKNHFEELFSKTYYSFQHKMRKPDKEIFDLVMKENSLRAPECVYIDDSMINAEAAQNSGMNAIHHSEGMNIESDLMSVLSAF
jgi:putative hydrolase of the HAD superfamily